MTKNSLIRCVLYDKPYWRRLSFGVLFIVLFYSINNSTARTPIAIDTTELTSRTFDCIVEPSTLVQLGSAVPGRIENIYVERNDSVVDEQVVVELESEVARTVVESARAKVKVTSTIEIRERYAHFSEQQVVRTKELFSRKMVSEQEYQRLVSEADIAKLQLIEAKDNQTLDYLSALQTEAQLDQLTIRSPISGVVVERYKNRGENVDDDPILAIANIDTLNVETVVPVSLMGSVQLGMTAQITLSPAHYGTHEATVILFDKLADAPSGTFRVRLQIVNPDHKLPAGLRCVAQFNDVERPPVIMSAHPVDRRSHHPSDDEFIRPENTIDELP